MKPSFKSGRTAVGVWGCFMDTILGPLVIIPKGARINQTRYTEEILKPYFVSFYRKMRRKYGKEVVMQKDGAKYHFAPIPAKYKDSFNIKRLKWPP